MRQQSKKLYWWLPKKKAAGKICLIFVTGKVVHIFPELNTYIINKNNYVVHFYFIFAKH